MKVGYNLGAMKMEPADFVKNGIREWTAGRLRTFLELEKHPPAGEKFGPYEIQSQGSQVLGGVALSEESCKA